MTSDQLDAVIAATEISDELRAIVETAEHNGHRRVREPLVYRARGERSYLVDLAKASRGDGPAAERLERHGRQMTAVAVETRAHPDAEYEYRVNPNTTLGTGGEFAPPLWLNEYFATARRPGEVIQRLVRENGGEFTLPDGASSINLPKVTQGATVNDDTPGDPVDNQDVETTPVKAEALYYSGESDWPIQALEQSPQGAHLDWAMFRDMGEALDAGLEEDFITGRGESLKEALGLLEITGTNSVTYTSGSPSGTGLFTEIGKALAQVGSKRKRPPSALLMGSSRFFWLATSEDTANRPLTFTDYPESDFPIVGLDGVGVYLDDAISMELVAGKEQDAILAVRPEDFMLWHSPVRTAVLEEPLSGTLGVRFLLYRSTATMLHRYPTGIAKITGTGLKVPAGFS